ncbi:MAG: Single-stranded DNA binding protein [Halodesulfurarchaeum sp.]
MNIEKHAEDLAADLDAEKSALKEDLENLLSYSVPVEEATASLRRKYGDADAGTTEPGRTDVASVTPESGSVSVLVRVLTVGRRRIRYQGEDVVIYEGDVADETGRISYTAWEAVDWEPGDVVVIGNASVREFQGEPELNIGEQTTVESADTPVDAVSPIGGDTSLRDLEPGDRGRNVEVRVLEVESRTIDGRDGETSILSGVIADPSARLPFTDWDPHERVEADASLRLENVYVREFRGVPSVNITEFTTIESLGRTVSPSDPIELSIREAVSRGAVYDLEVQGTVVDLRDGSGLIARCPECGRVVQKGQCRTHGDVDPVDDLRVKAVLDDGTESLTAVLDADLTESIYGGTLEDAREAAEEAMDQDVVADRIAETIVGKEYRARGHLSVDDFGATLEVTDFGPVDGEPADRASAFLEVAGE